MPCFLVSGRRAVRKYASPGACGSSRIGRRDARRRPRMPRRWRRRRLWKTTPQRANPSKQGGAAGDAHALRTPALVPGAAGAVQDDAVLHAGAPSVLLGLTACERGLGLVRLELTCVRLDAHGSVASGAKLPGVAALNALREFVRVPPGWEGRCVRAANRADVLSSWLEGSSEKCGVRSSWRRLGGRASP